MNLISILIVTSCVFITGNIKVGGLSQRKIRFSVINKKNMTGHYTTHLLVKQVAKDLPEIWKVDVEHEIIESEGLKTSNLLAVLTVPPQLPAGYKLIPGIGFYKFHDTVNDFDNAVEICRKEGGHLTIINSEDEANALKGSITGYAFIGIHDRYKEGEFISIFGQSLKDVGFGKWSHPNEPSGGTSENCGSLYPNGGINDISCNTKLPFICEYDLSWFDV